MNLIEALVRKKVIFKGQLKTKYKTDRGGYKVVVDRRTGAVREVRMSTDEIRNRMIASKKRARKLKGRSSQIARKRRMSMQKRKSWSS